jgi:hypothetical protein
MEASSQYADRLRAVGRFLDDIQASGVGVDDRGGQWLVTWEPTGIANFSLAQIEALRTVARLHRGHAGDMPRLTTSQMLRVLGEELDRLEASSFALNETADGYFLTWVLHGERSQRDFSFADLQQRLAERLTGR